MAEQKTSEKKLTLETLAAFAKRKGFIFQSSEIYGGFSAVYDYGHYGALLKNNIQNLWWKSMIKREDVYGLDSAIFTHPTVWKASGHVDSFVEPEIDCRNCKSRLKADHLLEPHGIAEADRMPLEEINAHVKRLQDQEALQCPVCGSKDLTEAKNFDLLVKSNLGSPTEKFTEENVVYLRGETCQGIYLNYKNYLQSMRAKLPFGIAQAGKAFRNEVVARQFIFRTREFEQLEMQYFLHPDDMNSKYDMWKEERMKWHQEVLGIPSEKLKWHEHEKLAHYASAAYDIQYSFASMENEFAEIEGIHQRGDWDLSRHQEFSGESMEYYDQERNQKYIPHIMETSAGLTRLLLMVLDNGYTEETLEDGSTRTLLKLKPSIAPVKAAIFPLVRKDEGLVKIARGIYAQLSSNMMLEYDENGSVGKRYRRQDEIGTPFCITVDSESLKDNTVTVRDRDSLEQVRVKVEELQSFLNEKLI